MHHWSDTVVWCLLAFLLAVFGFAAYLIHGGHI